MKQYLLGLIYAVAASAAWAQSPGTVGVAPEAHSVISTSASAASAVMTTTAQAGTALGHCESGCCPKTKTVCVSAPAIETKTKVLFSSDCETKCHKAPFQFLRKGGDCNSCQAGGACGHSYVERSLYKRVQTTACESYKCVPTQVPVCETPKRAPCAPVCASNACPSAPAAAAHATISFAETQTIAPTAFQPAQEAARRP